MLRFHVITGSYFIFFFHTHFDLFSSPKAKENKTIRTETKGKIEQQDIHNWKLNKLPTAYTLIFYSCNFHLFYNSKTTQHLFFLHSTGFGGAPWLVYLITPSIISTLKLLWSWSSFPNEPRVLLSTLQLCPWYTFVYPNISIFLLKRVGVCHFSFFQLTSWGNIIIN